MKRDNSGKLAQDEEFHGEIRHIRGTNIRVDDIKGRTRAAVRAKVVDGPRDAIVGKVTGRDKRATRAARAQLARLEKARDQIADTKRRAAADRAIAKFRKDNGL